MFFVLLDECLGCGACEDVCPQDSISLDDEGIAHINEFKCIGCGARAEICPADCLRDDGNGYYYDWYDSDFNITVFNNSEDTWTGVPYEFSGNDTSGIDCSHLVWQIYNENGLPYTYASTSKFANSSSFIQVYNPVDGDVVLWAGHHMGIYISNPPIPGQNLYSATTSKGVRYTSISLFIELYGPQLIIDIKEVIKYVH